MSEAALTPSRALAIARIAQLAMRLLARRSGPRDRAAASPSVPQVALLLIVDGAPDVRPVDLALQLGLAPPLLGAMLNCLEDQGVIRRERPAEDRRLKRIVLTDRGLALVAAAQRQFMETLSAVANPELALILQRLETQLDAVAPSPS